MGNVFAEIGSSILLFLLVFGMSATVEFKQLSKQIRNVTALCLGVCMQFVVLPFIGFVVVKVFNLSTPVGITLLVITSSPGGSYSNWWCSMFNAELSLSVCMTALSTLLSTIMLPTNLILYTRWTYSSAVVKSLDWTALFVSLIVVFGGIIAGLTASAYVSMSSSSTSVSTNTDSVKRAANAVLFRKRANQLGNLAGISLITLSATVSSSNEQAKLWDQDLVFFVSVALPALAGLSLATYFSSKVELEKPERVAVAVEACYQNTGIATSVALTMFRGEELATAIGVPLYYGIVEAVLLAIFCIVCWQYGWTKAPPTENVCVMLYKSYEVEDDNDCHEVVSIEVQRVTVSPSSAAFSSGNDGQPTSQQHQEQHHDLIFAQTENGAYVVDEETLTHITSMQQQQTKRKHTHATVPVTDDEGDFCVAEGTESSTATMDGDDVLVDSSGSGRGLDAKGIQLTNQQKRDGEGTRWGGKTLATLRARAGGYLSPTTKTSEDGGGDGDNIAGSDDTAVVPPTTDRMSAKDSSMKVEDSVTRRKKATTTRIPADDEANENHDENCNSTTQGDSIDSSQTQQTNQDKTNNNNSEDVLL